MSRPPLETVCVKQGRALEARVVDEEDEVRQRDPLVCLDDLRDVLRR